MNKFIKFLPLIIFVIALSWRLVGLNAQGETWDEIVYFDAGHSYLANIKNLDFNANHWGFNREHPPIAKFIYAAVSIPSYINHTTDYTNGRVASAIMGALTILIVYFLAKDLFSVKVAALSAIILTFMPNLVGLNKVYGLDTPTLLFFTLTIYLFISACYQKSHRLFIFSSLSLGLAIGTRFNNVILFALLPIIYLTIFNRDIFKRENKIFLIYFISVPLISVLFLFATWPWLWENTKYHLEITIGHWSAVKELFLGNIQIVPNTYYPVYLLITTPVIILFLIIPFFCKLIIEKNEKYYILFFWLLACFLVTLSPTKQGGMRYFICAYPAVAMMASIGFFYLYRGIIRYFFGIVLLAYLIIINLSVHPYYLTYYNEIVGGTRNVYEKKLFPIGWWGEGVEEAAIWTSNNAPRNAKVDIMALPNHTTGNKLRSDIKITSKNPDYIIINLNATFYRNITIPENFRSVKVVKSGSVPFVTIYQKQSK